MGRRLGELHGVPSIDTDVFMTEKEREAVEEGRYTQAMRLANIRRYGAHVRDLLRDRSCLALADGLPNAEAREYLRSQLPGVGVVFVLVEAPRELWQGRLESRDGNTVNIGVAEADAYVREHWEAMPASFEHETVMNGEDEVAVDDALRALHGRHCVP